MHEFEFFLVQIHFTEWRKFSQLSSIIFEKGAPYHNITKVNLK